MEPTSSLSEGFANLPVGDLPVNLAHEPIVRDDAPSLARVSHERDRFIDDDHKPLDAQLMKTFSAFRELNKEPDFPALLSNVTLGDQRLVTHSLGEAEDLLKRQPSINTLLHKAWKEGSFKEVRQLGAFFVPQILSFERLIIIKGILWPVAQESPSGKRFCALVYWDR